MTSTPIRIVAQPEDPELRRYRREMLTRWPLLRRAQIVVLAATAAAIAWMLFETLRG